MYNHYQVALTTLISLTLSLSLSFIICLYHPLLLTNHLYTYLNKFLLVGPGCLVCLTRRICEMSGRWPDSVFWSVAHRIYSKQHGVLLCCCHLTLSPWILLAFMWCIHTEALTLPQFKEIPLCSPMVRETGVQSSGWVIPKTQKMVLDAILLNTQNSKVWIKGKGEQSRKWSSAIGSSSYWKGSLGSPSATVANFTYIYIYICVCVCVCVCVWLSSIPSFKHVLFNNKDAFLLYNFIRILSSLLTSVLVLGWTC